MVAPGDSLSREASAYLESGRLSSIDPAEIVAECDRYIRRLAQRELRDAVALAKKLEKRVRKEDKPVRGAALRTLAWVQHLSASYNAAEEAYLEARSLLAGDAEARARIDRILIDVYMYLGDFAQAQRRARNAIRTFRRIGDHDGEAKTRVNYGNLYHRQDRHRDALQQYRRAMSYYSDGEDKLTLALCQYNCANSLVQLLEFDEADRLYRSAEKLFDELDYELFSNEARYGRAWLEKLRGNYHLSLRALAACEEHYARVGQPKGVTNCQLDRAEVLLELNLHTDARALAREAERRARKLGIDYEAAKAALFTAKAAYGLGKRGEMGRALGRARTTFEQQKNTGMLAVVRFYDALYRKRGETKKDIEAARKMFGRAQLPLWQAVCDLTAAASSPNDGRAPLRRLERNRAVQAVPHLFAGWQTIVGDRAASAGKTDAARRHWTQAAEALDQMRAKLPPVDLRHSPSVDDLDPHQRLFHSHVADTPETAAIWSERGRTAGVWSITKSSDMPQVRHSIGKRLVELAQHVTALSTSLERTRGEAGSGSWASSSPYRKLQSEIRRGLLTLTRSDSPTARETNWHEMIRRHAAVCPVVQFHAERDRLVAFIHRAGETEVRVLTDADQTLRQFLGQWSLLLGRILAAGKRVRKSDREEEARLLQQLGDWLWTPLEISRHERQVVLLPSGPLAAVPWSALIVDGKPLADLHQLVLSPSFMHLERAGRVNTNSGEAHVFVGNTAGLRYTADEIELIHRLKHVTAHVHENCVRDDWPEYGQARLWHYVGHAHFRGDNPFYSSLSLADGPLFAADFRLRQCQVDLVTLAACRTGVQSSLPSYESTGLVRSLLEMGARQVVASHWAVSDRATADWMKSFYSYISDGRTAPEAAQAATIQMKSMYPSACQWAAFSVFGAR